ncbi:ADP-ribosylation factor family-domain-containing protein [Mycena pura]|uniref:ADP-ribosylation factor family-domain-containing protein n=1 Tax=Mycena pura TaxID=153505 RepID=A0AAD6VGD7_9AGAR|nr:ADP-ribosylation factor family-domain-containing protein [Mycena pura]
MGATTSSITAASKEAFFPKSFEIMIIGLDGAGTTSILNRLHRRELPTGVLPMTIPTIGFNIETVAHARHRLTIWEAGGQDKIRPLWRRYYWNALAFAFALDASAPERLPEAREELHRMCGEVNEHPLLILANKMDLPGAMDLAHITEALGIEEIAKRCLVAVKGVSAMTGEGLAEMLDWFVANVSHQDIARHNENKKNMTGAW